MRKRFACPIIQYLERGSRTLGFRPGAPVPRDFRRARQYFNEMLRGQLDAFLHPCDSYASRIAAAVTVCELEVRAARLLGDPLPALTPEWLKLEGVGRLQREAVTDQYCAAAALAWYKYHTNMHPDAYEHIQIIPDTAGVFLACPEYPLRLQRA